MQRFVGHVLTKLPQIALKKGKEKKKRTSLSARLREGRADFFSHKYKIKMASGLDDSLKKKKLLLGKDKKMASAQIQPADNHNESRWQKVGPADHLVPLGTCQYRPFGEAHLQFRAISSPVVTSLIECY